MHRLCANAPLSDGIIIGCTILEHALIVLAWFLNTFGLLLPGFGVGTLFARINAPAQTGWPLKRGYSQTDQSRIYMQTNTQPTTGNTSITLTPDLFALIDHAGALDQEIKALTKQLDKLKDTIKAQGAGDFSGFAWTAKVVEVKATDKTDWQTIALRPFSPI